MAYYDVTATFEVEADSIESAERYAVSSLSRISTGEYTVETVGLSADQGDEENA